MGNGVERWVEERRKELEKLEVSLGEGRGGESEPPEWDMVGGGGVRLHPMGNASVPGASPASPVRQG